MEELDLKELISIFMKRKVLIILVIIIFALIGAIYTTKFITPTYKSSTSLVLVQTGTEKNLYGDNGAGSITTSDVTLNSKLVDNYMEIATSRDKVLSKVVENLNLDMTVAELEKIITIAPKTNTEVLEITVEHTDAELSCRIVNEIAKVFIDAVEQIYKLNNLSVLDEAKVPQAPSNVHLAKNVVIFAFVGGILVSGYILLINMLDTTVKSDTDIERALNVPVLASIVLTNENAKKNVQTQADNLYKVSGFDNVEPEVNSSPNINVINNGSLFENYNTDEETSISSEKIEEIEEVEEDVKTNSESKHKNNNYKSRNKNKNKKQSRNRRNG